jgi:hypothetical protein
VAFVQQDLCFDDIAFRWERVKTLACDRCKNPALRGILNREFSYRSRRGKSRRINGAAAFVVDADGHLLSALTLLQISMNWTLERWPQLSIYAPPIAL